MNNKICVIGLGYVGIQVALSFGQKYDLVGYDINSIRVSSLKRGVDKDGEVSKAEIKKAKYCKFTNKLNDIKDANIYIVCVPTPIDKNNIPDLNILRKASAQVGKYINNKDIIIYESTVYPGVTEEICVPIIEKESGLKYIFNDALHGSNGFYCGYSPERINPSDKNISFTSINKIVSGSTKETLLKIDKLYKSVLKAKTVKVSSIRVAEATKVIENIQRDVNIALINEISIIFNKISINTEEVINAASSKWNFNKYTPGMVGGHCISVDPYYLTYKAREIGLVPSLIESGRRINNKMSLYIFKEVTRLIKKKKITTAKPNILVMGITYKENLPDIRNSKVVDLIEHFKKAKCNISVYDPVAIKSDVLKEYKIKLLQYPKKNNYDAIILTVAHEEFRQMGISKIKYFGKEKNVIYDVKWLFSKELSDGCL